MKDKDALFLNACKENNFEEVKKLVLEGDVDIDSFDEWERSGLQIVCKNNNLEMAEFLIKHGAKADVNDRYCSSPLWEAVENNNYELVKLILAQGIIYPMCDGGEYSYDRIIDEEYIKIDENIRILLIEAEEVAEKKRHINFLERQKKLSESVAKDLRKETLEEFIKETFVENKYKYNEIALKKFIKKLGKEFVESALAYEEEFVKTGFTIEYKYDSDKNSYSVNKKYH